MSATPRRHRAGFTLMEVLAVVLMTTLLLGVALDFYMDLSNQSARASDYTREVRRASSILDRVAADFERALLVKKPEETDPLAHPWIFVAEARYAEQGADRVKFVMRQTPRATEGPAADVAMVAYMLRPSEEGPGFELRRWTSPGLPDGLDRDFPAADDPNALLLADGIESFALRFLDENGEWQTRWDSSQIVESSELPLAVEIDLSLVDPREASGKDLGLDAAEPTLYARQVELPVRPLDLETLLDPETYAAAGGAGREADQGDSGLTLADCIDFSKIGGASGAAGLAGMSATDLSTLAALAAKADSTPFAPYRALVGNHPAVNPQCR